MFKLLKDKYRKSILKIKKWNRLRNYFMKTLRMYIVCLLFDRKNLSHFNPKKIKKILYLRHDNKIGDMIVATSLFRECSRAGFIMDILSGPDNFAIVEFNPWVNQVFILEDNKTERKKLIKKLKKKNYDLVIDMGDIITPWMVYFLNKIHPKNVIGFNRNDYKIYNQSLDYFYYKKHITMRCYLLMKCLKLKKISVAYNIYYPDKIKVSVLNFFSSLSRTNKKIIINPYTSNKFRNMSIAQIFDLVQLIKNRWPNTDVIFIGKPEKIKNLIIPNTYLNPFRTIASAAEMIRLSDLVITPDTSIVHIAAIWKKSMICLYSNDINKGFVNNLVWGPGYPQAIQIKTKSHGYPIATIDVNKIIANIKYFLDA